MIPCSNPQGDGWPDPAGVARTGTGWAALGNKKKSGSTRLLSRNKRGAAAVTQSRGSRGFHEPEPDASPSVSHHHQHHHHPRTAQLADREELVGYGASRQSRRRARPGRVSDQRPLLAPSPPSLCCTPPRSDRSGANRAPPLAFSFQNIPQKPKKLIT